VSSPTRARPDQHTDALARLFDAVHEGLFVGVLPDNSGSGGTTLVANPHLRQMLGVAPDTPDGELQPFAPRRFADAAAWNAFAGRIAAEGAVTDYPARLLRDDGSAVWVEITARAERAGAHRLQVEAVVRDVTERRRLDERSREFYQQLVHAEKMAALGQTISGVAHELNNPLATILSWAERLAERPLDEVSRRGLTVILGEAERAARIVRNLLTFARKRQSTRALVDINAIVSETLALRAYEQRVSNIRLTTTLASALPPVFADGHQIQQVLLNLVINGEQAMVAAHGAGMLTVQTRHDAERGVVEIDVGDDGPGIPADVAPRIFEPFFTTKQVGEGTGLGLTVAYAIVQDHGGRIRLESRPHATSFVVELPVSAATVSKPQRPPAPAMDAVRGATVLLVEDEVALATAVAEALTDAGLEVTHAADGEDALARLRHATYGVVICDLKMPRVDGRTLYRAIASASPALARRVIFVTGDVAGSDVEAFLADTGCRWLAKPFRLADLLRAVRDTLA
jgi:two-component system NtrC family sensor kinase